MRKILAAFAGASALLLVSGTAAFASGLHFFQNQDPQFQVSGNTISASGQVAGAGTYINANLQANYTFPVSCYNPGNDAGPVPGHSGSGSATGSTGPIQTNHGNATFNVSATATPTVSGNPCPGSGWTYTTGPVTFSSATLTITSSNGGSLTCTYTVATGKETCK
jgi:hypothetical protein